MQLWVHRFCLGLVWGSTLVPIFYSADYMYGFITLKSFIFRGLTALLVPGCLYLIKTTPGFSFRFNLYLLSWIGLLVWMLLTSFTGADPERSVWSTFERMDGFVGYLWLFLYLLCLPVLVRTQRDWYRLFSISCGVAAILALTSLVGVSDWYTPYGRLFLTFGNPAVAAAYYGFHIFFICFLAKQFIDQYPDKERMILAGAAALLGLFFTVCVQTQSRSIVIPVLICLAGLSTYLITYSPRFFDRRILYFVIMGLFIVGNVIYFSSELSGFFKGEEERSSLQARIDTWQFGWDGICQKPLTGWGIDNFGYAMTATFTLRSHSDELWYDRTHNAFLEWGISAGWLGFLGYLSLFAAMFYRFVKTRTTTPEVTIMIAAMGFYLVSHMANIDTLTTSICLVWVFAFLDQHLPEDFSIYISKAKMPGLPLSIAIMIVIATLFYCSVWQSARTNRRTLQLLRSSQPAYVARELTSLYRNALQGKYEIAEQMALLVNDLDTQSTDALAKETLYNATLRILDDQYRTRPQFMRLLDILGEFLKRAPAFEVRKQSIEVFHEMADRMPLRAESNYRYGLSLLENGNYSMAHKVMTGALRIKPDESRYLLGLARVNAKSENLEQFRGVLNKIPVRYAAENFAELRSSSTEKAWGAINEFFRQNLLPEHDRPMPPLFYWQWAQSCFDSGDFTTCKSALYMFYTFYGKNPLVLAIREDVDKGIRPPEVKVSQ